MSDQLQAWEKASRPSSERGVLPHVRQASTAAPESPASRLIELTREATRLQQFLAEACVELRKARRENEQWHSFEKTSFGGYPMAQHFGDLVVWESVLNSTPDLMGIVEIGTWQGGFSWWLWAQAEARGLGFITYDAVQPERFVPCFRRLDVFAQPDVIGKAAQSVEPCVLFCDGGNKPRELKTFPGYLKDPRSIVAVHDWGTETMPADVPDSLEPLHEDFCVEMKSVTRFFRVSQ